MTKKQAHIVKSAKRVLEVLEYFDRDHPVATVMDISRALSYPQSSTSVLLRCLKELGYLYFNRYDRTYRPTARVALLGSWVGDGVYRAGKVLTLVDRISERLGETVVLSSGVDHTLHHLHVVRGVSPNAVSIKTGQIEPLLHSAAGELLMASYPDQQIRLALHRLNAEEENPERRVSVGTKLKDLQAVRQRQWILRSVSEGRRGAVAVLMPRRKGGDRLVLSVVAESRVIDRRGEEFLEVVLEERNRIFPNTPVFSGRSASAAAHGAAPGASNKSNSAPSDKRRASVERGGVSAAYGR
jgi:DNA-binding IclR family transcriptional regulator